MFVDVDGAFVVLVVFDSLCRCDVAFVDDDSINCASDILCMV